ncbi:MAG: 1-acyl-sn-glycerol-3-phosphate acyltransferase [Chloroflexi bacterium]|nr:MAG: 1-acyl-sn-glycerol-3-phosphate acyltransferase [Chloroflexota bacterium]
MADDLSRMPPWPRFLRAALRVAMRLVFRPRVVGTAPSLGPYLIVANHRSWLDGFMLLSELPAEPRLYFFADWNATAGSWWKRLIIGSLGAFVLVDRRAAFDRSAVADTLKLLGQGGVLVFFPEGLPAHDEERVDPFRRGVGFLALRAKVPVVPIWMRGTGELYLGREVLAKIGVPVSVPDLEPNKENTERVAAWLREEVLKLGDPWVEPQVAKKRLRWLTHLF